MDDTLQQTSPSVAAPESRAAGQTPEAPPAPAAEPGRPATSAAGAPPAQQAGQPQAGGQPPQGQQGVLDQLRQYGVEGNFASDAQALQYLAGVHRQAAEWRQLAGYGNQYLQHQTEFQEYLRARQQQQQQAQAQQQASWWKAPEYDPAWLQKIYRDPQTGEPRVLPGNDPTILQKLAAWTDHQRGFIDRFSQDPIGAIRPGIQELVRAEAQALIAQHLGGYQERNVAQQIVQQHGAWMYERGGDGAPVLDQSTRRPLLNEWGRRYAGYVQEAVSSGVGTAEAQDRYALGMVQRDYLAYRSQQAGQQQQAQPAGEAAREQFLAGAQRRPGSASAAAPPNPGAAPNGQAGSGGERGLAALLQKNLAAAGFGPGQAVSG